MNSSFELEKKSNKKLTSNVLYCKVLKSFLNFMSSHKEEEITSNEDEITVQQFLEDQNEKNF